MVLYSIDIVEGVCMPIVFHLAKISFLFRRQNLSAIKEKAVSSCDTSQFILSCHTLL